jgi:hypothetical protein
MIYHSNSRIIAIWESEKRVGMDLGWLLLVTLPVGFLHSHVGLSLLLWAKQFWLYQSAQGLELNCCCPPLCPRIGLFSHICVCSSIHVLTSSSPVSRERECCEAYKWIALALSHQFRLLVALVSA